MLQPRPQKILHLTPKNMNHRKCHLNYLLIQNTLKMHIWKCIFSFRIVLSPYKHSLWKQGIHMELNTINAIFLLWHFQIWWLFFPISLPSFGFSLLRSVTEPKLVNSPRGSLKCGHAATSGHEVARESLVPGGWTAARPTSEVTTWGFSELSGKCRICLQKLPEYA